MSNFAENQALHVSQDVLLRSYLESFYAPLCVPVGECLAYREHLAKREHGWPITNRHAVPPQHAPGVNKTWKTAAQYFLDVRFTVLGESKAAGDAECKSIDTFGLNIVPCIRFGKPVVDVLCLLMRQSFDFFYDYQHEDRVLKKQWEKFYVNVRCANYVPKGYFFCLQRQNKVRQDHFTTAQLYDWDAANMPKRVAKVSSLDLNINYLGNMIKKMITVAKYESVNDPVKLRDMLLAVLEPKLKQDSGKFDAESMLAEFTKDYVFARGTHFLTNSFVYFANQMKVQNKPFGT